MELTDLPEWLLPGGGLATLAAIALWLIRRGDVRDRDAFVKLKELYEEWRSRAEDAEAQLTECRHELISLRVQVGLLPDGTERDEDV